MAYGISIQDLLQAAPEEADLENASVVTITNGSIGRLPATNFNNQTVNPSILASLGIFCIAGEGYLDNGVPDAVTQALIDDKISQGWPASSVFWIDLGGARPGVQFGAGYFSTTYCTPMVYGVNGVGIAIGTGAASVINITGDITGLIGLGISIGYGYFEGAAVVSFSSELAGTGLSLTQGISSVSPISLYSAVSALGGIGVVIGDAIVAPISAISQVTDLAGVGQDLVIYGQAYTSAESAASAIADISGVGVIIGSASLSAITSSAGVVTVTGIGVAIGNGSVSVLTSGAAVTTITGVGQGAAGPAQVTGLVVSGTPAPLTATWSAASGATSYKVYYNTTNNVSTKTFAGATTNTYFNFANLIYSPQTFYVWIVSSNGTVDGTVSSVASALSTANTSNTSTFNTGSPSGAVFDGWTASDGRHYPGSTNPIAATYISPIQGSSYGYNLQLIGEDGGSDDYYDGCIYKTVSNMRNGTLFINAAYVDPGSSIRVMIDDGAVSCTPATQALTDTIQQYSWWITGITNGSSHKITIWNDWSVNGSIAIDSVTVPTT